MQSCSAKSAMKKLRMDVVRSCDDHNLHGGLSSFKLLLVVDFWPVLYFRLIEHCRENKGFFRRLIRLLLLPFKPIVDGFSGARIYADSIIGGGLLLHQSSGVVIAPGVVLGENCTFFSGACVVYKANDKGNASPRIGNNVKLMVGCKIIGDVIIGDNVSVGANAVVIKSIPENCIAVGIPARWADQAPIISNGNV